MYFGKRFYRFYNHLGGRNLNECLRPLVKVTDFVVQVSTSSGRYYAKFVSCASFYYWSRQIPAEEMTFSEVVKEGKQKFRLDIDEKVANINEVVRKVKLCLSELKVADPVLLVFDIEKSYHIVLTNYYFDTNCQCKRIASCLAVALGVTFLDLGVYNKLQHFRLEECTKFGERRWKRRIGSVCSSKNFHEGVVSDTVGTKKFEHSDTFFKEVRGTSSRLDTAVTAIPPEFRVRRVVSEDYVFLDRVANSYCKMCKRTHSRENAFIKNGVLGCWRFSA
jgi:hypothetical protein